MQCSIAQIFKANGTNDFCYNFCYKETKNPLKSRSNSCSKAEKQKFEAKTVIKYSSLETVCDLCLQRLSYKSTEKLNFFEKTKIENPILLLKTDIPKSHNRLRITTKSNELSFKNLRRPIGPVNNETTSRAHKKNKIIKKTKL